MRERRFLVESVEGAETVLTGAQRHHAVDVLRLGVGSEVIVFDGRGGEAAGRIERIDPGCVVIALSEARRGARTSGIPLTLAVAAPKGARADWLVEKCAELGVCRLVLLDTRRGSVILGAGKLDRWRRKAVEAAKQSGAAAVMAIEGGATIEDICRDLPEAAATYYGETGSGSESWLECLPALLRDESRPSMLICFVGPEGGFAEDERARLRASGVRPVSFGMPTLRVETAAIAAAAIWCGFRVE